MSFIYILLNLIIFYNPKLKKMKKIDLIKEMSKKTGLSRDDASRAVESFMDIITKSIINRESVILRGFGSFVPKERAEKKARNISTGKEIIVPAHWIPAFKPSKEFKEAVKG